MLMVLLESNYRSKAHPLDGLLPFRSSQWGMYFITGNFGRCSGYTQTRAEHEYVCFWEPGVLPLPALCLDTGHRPNGPGLILMGGGEQLKS